MNAIEKKKRSSFACPVCNVVPCKCAGGGGGDSEKKDKNSKSENKSIQNDNENSSLSNHFIKDSALSVSLIMNRNPIQSTFLSSWCTLFASTPNQLAMDSSNHLQEDNASNTTNSSFTMGMKMGGMDE